MATLHRNILYNSIIIASVDILNLSIDFRSAIRNINVDNININYSSITLLYLLNVISLKTKLVRMNNMYCFNENTVISK